MKPPPAPPQGARRARLMKLTYSIGSCVNSSGVKEEGDDWANDILSWKTVRGPSGKIGLPGEVEAKPVAGELKLCVRLAAAAKRIVGEMETGMGSAGGQTFDRFFVARHGQWRCRALKPGEIRPAFGSALYPAATIKGLPLEERTSWWKTVVKCFRLNEETEEPPDEGPGASDTMRNGLRRWRKAMAWFHEEKAFVEVAFVEIDKMEAPGIRGGCVFPRLLLGRTRGGSIAGLFGAVVYR